MVSSSCSCEEGSRRLGPSSTAILRHTRQPFTLIDPEAVIAAKLLRGVSARDGSPCWLLDYDTHLIHVSIPYRPLPGMACGCTTQHPVVWPNEAPVEGLGSGSAAGSCTVLLAALLASRREPDRCFILVVKTALHRCAPVEVFGRAEVQLPSSCREWTPGLMRQAAKQKAMALIQRGAPVLASPAHAAIVLSNASVLNTERSLSAIVHPMLPVCIRGYRNTPHSSRPSI